MTGADLLVAALHNCGIDTAFGIPGFHSNPIYDALRRHGAVNHVLVRHEQTAGFAADGYARASGRIACAITTAGPGATNLATPLAEALSDAIPLLAVTADVDPESAGRGAYHELAKFALLRPAVKWAARARQPDDIPELVARAIHAALSGRPGPVHLEVPEPVLRAEGSDSPHVRVVPPRRRATSECRAHRAVDVLCEARFPVILAGGGVISAGAEHPLQILAETLHAPVLTTMMGRGALPDRHELAGGFARSPLARRILEHADAMLAIGCRFSEVTTGGWSMRVPRPLIHVDIDPRAFDCRYRADLQIPGDARRVVDQLIGRLARRPAAPPERLESLARIRREVMEAPAKPDDERSAFAAALRAAVPDDGIVVSDVLHWWDALYSRFPVYSSRTLLVPALFIAMGYALPAAIGAAAACPGRPVVAVMGDGGFFISGMELATAADLGQGLVVILDNNGELGVIRRMQEDAYHGQ
ncbi:MAG TPA: thiamine pyrophosphate-binding protein, partial [Armatimonadota bacterium]|nr:thiamine pyrophosphate-binding protein [Armatimonadota bacterium]